MTRMKGHKVKRARCRFLFFILFSFSLLASFMIVQAGNGYLTMSNPHKGTIIKIPRFSINDIDYLRLIDVAGFFDSDVQSFAMSQRFQIDVFGQPAVFQVGRNYFFIEQLLLRTTAPVILFKGHVCIPLESLQLMLKSLSSYVVQWNDKANMIVLLRREPGTTEFGSIDGIVRTDGSMSSSGVSSPGRKIRSITIDAGHGGKDSGAIGPTGIKEKDVVLTIAKLLRDQLKRKYGIEVFLTRDSDIFLPLAQRTAIANNNKSDIFISIHTNSVRKKSTTGFEVYFLNKQPSDEFARATAKLENLDMDDRALDMSTMNTDLQSILWDLIQNKYLVESSILAEKILSAYEVVFKTQARGVKQAPFYVLMGAEMPAVLVEIDFISNPTQEKRLTDKNHISKIIDALVHGIDDFKQHYEKILGADLLKSGKRE